MNSAGELPIVLDRALPEPLPVQIAAALRDAIDSETLRPSEPLPSSRGLASRLGVARGVIVAAYEQLQAEGYVLAGHGRGTVVHPELANRPSDDRGELRLGAGSATASVPDGVRDGGRDGVHDSVHDDEHSSVPTSARGGRGGRRPQAAPGSPGPLAPGVPLTDGVDRPQWRAAWRAAAKRVAVSAPDLGDAALRTAIAEHLRRMRGTNRAPADVLVTAGVRDGLSLLLTTLGTTRGNEIVVGVEDPGYPSLRRLAARHGARIVALPVDGDGLVTSTLPAGILDVVIVTPSHQYPLGGSLPLARRRELLEWARRTGAIIVEDDYDSELRHAGSPLPTLASLDDPEVGSVVLLGTFSKTLSPALAAGFLLAPKNLRQLLEPVRTEIGGPVSAIVQSALAEYLASGEHHRHIARMRRRYVARRDLLSEVLAAQRGWRIRPMSGGLHAVIELHPADPRREERLAAAARTEGLGAEGLATYWRGSSRDVAAVGTPFSTTGLVIGMGGADDEAFASALERLRQLLETVG